MLIIRVDGVGVGLLGERLAPVRETVTRSIFNEIVFRRNALDLWINKLGVIVRVGGVERKIIYIMSSVTLYQSAFSIRKII